MREGEKGFQEAADNHHQGMMNCLRRGDEIGSDGECGRE